MQNTFNQMTVIQLNLVLIRASVEALKLPLNFRALSNRSSLLSSKLPSINTLRGELPNVYSEVSQFSQKLVSIPMFSF